MAFFTSEYDCKLDAKGRLVLPARIKASLPESSGNELVIGLGFEKCLVVYPLQEFKKIYSKVAGLSEFNPDYRRLQRNFFRGNTVVELDNSGRFLIPRSMLIYAELEKSVTVVGMGNKVELWSPELYQEQLYSDQTEFSDNVQRFLDI
ncbi:MAG: division/cell wall cluster transcriptional repressor MraZ [Cyclobacteriaceae bacterium]|nr:division/cell wall cluster transcriptional repressor MraZ [Cyclobacteriaceae bacterium]